MKSGTVFFAKHKLSKKPAILAMQRVSRIPNLLLQDVAFPSIPQIDLIICTLLPVLFHESTVNVLVPQFCGMMLFMYTLASPHFASSSLPSYVI